MLRFFKVSGVLCICFLSIFLFVGCDVPESENLRVDSLTLNEEYIFLNVGETDVLLANVYPFNANNQNIIWSSSDASVVTVENGIITAQNTGSAKVFAISEEGNFSKACFVDVI